MPIGLKRLRFTELIRIARYSREPALLTDAETAGLILIPESDVTMFYDAIVHRIKRDIEGVPQPEDVDLELFSVTAKAYLSKQ